MENLDTIHLLKECDAGTKMAVTSIDEVIDSISDGTLKKILESNKDEHTKIGNELHALLNENHCDEKDPNPMAKSMSWLKTNFKMTMEPGDAMAAELITEGCDMGIRSLYKYMNQYSAANETAKALCTKIITVEEKLRTDLRPYL